MFVELVNIIPVLNCFVGLLTEFQYTPDMSVHILLIYGYINKLYVGTYLRLILIYGIKVVYAFLYYQLSAKFDK